MGTRGVKYWELEPRLACAIREELMAMSTHTVPRYPLHSMVKSLRTVEGVLIQHACNALDNGAGQVRGALLVERGWVEVVERGWVEDIGEDGTVEVTYQDDGHGKRETWVWQGTSLLGRLDRYMTKRGQTGRQETISPEWSRALVLYPADVPPKLSTCRVVRLDPVALRQYQVEHGASAWGGTILIPPHVGDVEAVDTQTMGEVAKLLEDLEL